MSEVIAPGSAAELAPVWQWDSIFPGGPEGAHFQNQQVLLNARLADLEMTFDASGVDVGQPLPEQAGQVFDAMVAATCDVLAAERLLSLYLAGMCWEHTDDIEASARYARFQLDVARLEPLVERLETWSARLALTHRLDDSELAPGHAQWLSRCVRNEAHRSSIDDLTADLARSATGRHAWQRLYEDLAGSLTVAVGDTSISVSEAQQLLNEPSADTRRTTQVALNRAWSALAIPASACLNAIKGDEIRLLRHTQWTDALTRSLSHHDIEASAFEAMQNAAGPARIALQEFARIKAAALGVRQLAWSDLAAPMPGETSLSWADGVAVLLSAFGAYSSELAAHSASVIEQGWVHAAPTRAKRPTALCLPLAGGTSRIMLTFDGSRDSLMSLAHELGHSYHYRMLAPCTELQRISPLPLLELPAMICEGLLAPNLPAPSEGALGRSDLQLLNAALIGDFQVLMGGHSRLLFESAVLERRRIGPISANQLRELMIVAQDTAYGDSLDRGTMPRETWMSHPHLYSSTLHSWPYVFALLKARSLTGTAGECQVSPGELVTMLARTGTASPASLARTLGVDLSDESFWGRGVDALEERVHQFALAVTTSGLMAGHAGAG